ncbi:lasso peptide biosynthesis B2 protein [Arundinibacter roseus]|uniref:Lasso peptide biosynthesis B2 protein n=1 Tax=Arundinibacter roseus TaxID=2070510 RepID=A0A4R4K3X4_9BACT|nr:lasso peptide biosynthesis B2 protein [Arundinibacter roseus]TDB61141.1 lasso peptide biosynthesis B2 protein [Arundinibacter roseus]
MIPWVLHIKKAGSLPLARYLALMQAASVLIGIKLFLVILPFRTFRRIYGKLTNPAHKQQYTQAYISDRIWAVRTAAHWLPFSLLCLPQALSLKFLLRKEDQLPLHIGVQIQASAGFEAHAWVEKNGKIIIGEWPENTTYKPIWVWQ